MVSEVRMSARSDLLFSWLFAESVESPTQPRETTKVMKFFYQSPSIFEERLFTTLNVLILSNCECCPGLFLTLI